MWKLIVGFLALVLFALIIGAGIYLFYTDKMERERNKKGDVFKKTKLPKGFPLDGTRVIGELDKMIEYLSSSNHLPSIVLYNTGPIYNILTNMRIIIQENPRQASGMYEITEFVIPLIKKFIADYCFYQSLNAITEAGVKGSATCKEGLAHIEQLLNKKADMMLQDKAMDLEAELYVFLKMHDIDFSLDEDIDGRMAEPEIQRLHQYVQDCRSGNRTKTNARPEIKQVQKGGDGSVQIQIAGNYTVDD